MKVILHMRNCASVSTPSAMTAISSLWAITVIASHKTRSSSLVVRFLTNI